MAIEFKNNLDINQNQLLDPVIELQDTDVNAGTGTQGQLYFNTTDQVLKVWNTTGGASWKSISGDITEVTSTTTSQLVVTNGTGPVASLAIQLGAIANGNLNLVTSDVIYDYIEQTSNVMDVTFIQYDEESRADIYALESPDEPGSAVYVFYESGMVNFCVEWIPEWNRYKNIYRLRNLTYLGNK